MTCKFVVVAALAALALAGCGSDAPGGSTQPGELRYFEYRIPDGGLVRCIERWPNNSAAVLDCSWPDPKVAK